jgi:cell division protein FtsQ
VILHQPIARWGEKGLINGRGEVFYPSQLNGFEDLLQLSGDPAQASMLLTVAVWLRQQTRMLNWQLLAVHRFKGGSLQTRWYPERTVWLSEQHYQQQFAHFLHAWPQLHPTLRERAAEVDLRYSNGFTIRVKEQQDYGAQKTE